MSSERVKHYKSLYDNISEGNPHPSINDCRDFLVRNGFQLDDPRWEELFHKLFKLEHLEENVFLELFQARLADIRRCIQKEFAIPDFIEFTKEIDNIFEEIKIIDQGETSKQIPQLSKKNPDLFGFSVCTINGQRYGKGDYQEPFTIQACANPINYAIALETCGDEKVHSVVDKEPSGQTFNAITFTDKGLPYNPLVNAGAIAICSIIDEKSEPATKFESIQKWIRRAAGGFKPDYDNASFLSERLTAERNYALARLMKSKGLFNSNINIDNVLEFYFQCCSIELDCNRLAIIAATLANGGICPITNERVFSNKTSRSVLSLMFSCGMYEHSGQFAFTIGIPAKSGISGCIMAVIPGICGFCVFSPRIDDFGNSLRGVKFCEELVKRYPFHNFELTQNISLRRNKSEQINVMFFACYENDLVTITKLIKHGMDVNFRDYDDRTPLHIACSEGNIEAVQLLLQYKADPNIKDRWGQSPLDNAIKAGHFDIEKIITKNNREINIDDFLNNLQLNNVRYN
jgi:glutaminase